MTAGDLAPAQLQGAAAAFADVHAWAGSAWRRLSTGVPVPTLASVLADAADMTTRLEELQALLGKSAGQDCVVKFGEEQGHGTTT